MVREQGLRYGEYRVQDVDRTAPEAFQGLHVHVEHDWVTEVLGARNVSMNSSRPPQVMGSVMTNETSL